MAATSCSIGKRAEPGATGRGAASPRYHELDGLRGWAAVQVVLFHLVLESFVGLFPDWRNPATAFFLNGHLAVCIFFILSGEALSVGTFSKRGTASAVSIMLKRYTRLTIPVAASCVIVVLLLRVGLVANVPAGRITQSHDWLATFLTSPLSLTEAIRYVAMDVYLGSDQDRALNPFLWTMQYEMAGSILVILASLAWDHLRNRAMLGAICFLALQITAGSAHVALFVVGMAFADLRQRGIFTRIMGCRYASPVSGIAIVAICAADGLIRYLDVPGALRFDGFAAIALLGACFCNRWVTKFLRNRLSQALGFLSFPLFLIQFPIIVSLTSWLIIAADRAGGIGPQTAIAIAATSFAACVAGAVAFTPVETLTSTVGRRIVQVFQRREPVAV